uniref:Uncharacterized protein n=1 Tax=Arion vulgaris TaxID=1028688 RepID=A0A0B7B0R6_9EUPU
MRILYSYGLSLKQQTHNRHTHAQTIPHKISLTSLTQYDISFHCLVVVIPGRLPSSVIDC